MAVMSLTLPCDPASFEIIRHKLLAIIDEAIIALENVSGSPITNEGHDMMVSLYRPNGDLMVGGVGYLYHLTSASQAVKHVLSRYGDDPGIEEGDAFLLNDSYTAALHPPDMYVISPIHFEGRLVAFVANFVHLTDIGAITPGGFSPEATDTFQEGFVTQGLKLISRGALRRDVLDTFLNNVRDPGGTALDLKSQLAANHTAADRLLRMCQVYGPELIDDVSEYLIDHSETRLRDRLGELPDGTWHARQYVDLPSGIRTLSVAMTKSGGELSFDFNGSSPQAEVGINATYWGTWGGIMGAIFPLLAWDIGWNDGVTRPVSMDAPAGTIVNAIRPAPISIATIGAVKTVNSLAATTISKMMAASVRYRDRATATWKGSHMNLSLFGTTRAGSYFVSLMTDSFAGAGGARATSDGVDLGGEISNQVGRWANAESQELNTPIRYLFRRPVTDSGGPGRYRGGVSHELAIVPGGTIDGSLEIGLFGLGLHSPYSQGLSGGLPGCNVDYAIVRDANSSELPNGLDDLRGSTVDSVQWGRFRVGSADALYVRGTGGGGYGDPLERDPSKVADDVGDGLVSAAVAHDIYGVELADGSFDPEATSGLRLRLRAERLGYEPRRPAAIGRGELAFGESEHVSVNDDGARTCARCDAVLATGARHWKSGVARRMVSPTAAGPRRESLPELSLVMSLCPECGTLLDTDLVLDGDDVLYDRPVLGSLARDHERS